MFLHALHLFTGYGALGNDASSHITTIETVATRIQNGQGWWSTDYNLGFPLALYYQPFPHIFSGLLNLFFKTLFNKTDSAIFTYKLVSVSLLLLQPWAIYYGARRAGSPKYSAAIAGAIAPLIVNNAGFGYTIYASMKLGLFTQNWGNFMLPLAFGELIAVIRNKTHLFRGILASTLLASSHMFYAIAMIPIIAMSLILWILNLKPFLRTKKLRRVMRDFSIIGVGAFAFLAPWLIPLALTQSYFGGWPFGRTTRVHGYGWSFLSGIPGENGEFIAGMLPHGFIDGSNFPILMLLGFVGILIVATNRKTRWLKPEYAYSILGLFFVSLIGTIGRAGFGKWIDLYPLHQNVQLFRYLAVLQFSFVLTAGLSLGLFIEWIEVKIKHITPFILVLIVIISLYFSGKQVHPQLVESFLTLEDAPNLVLDEYNELIAWLADLPVEGRVYVGRNSGISGHYHSGLLAYETQRPFAQSYGVGLHDSLHFYTLSFFDPRRAGAQALAQLYDFQYIISAPSVVLALDHEILHENAHYRLSRIRFREGSVAFFPDPSVERSSFSGTPRQARTEIRRWLNGNGPFNHQTQILDITNHQDRSSLLSGPIQVTEQINFTHDRSEIGQIIEAYSSADQMYAKVRLNTSSLVVFKQSFHPFWQFSLDNEPIEPLFVFPGFSAIHTTEGKHLIVAHFQRPIYTRWLFLFWIFPFYFTSRQARKLYYSDDKG